MLLLITESKVVTLANEATLSFENKKQLYEKNIEHKQYWKYSDWKYWVF